MKEGKECVCLSLFVFLSVCLSLCASVDIVVFHFSPEFELTLRKTGNFLSHITFFNIFLCSEFLFLM